MNESAVSAPTGTYWAECDDDRSGGPSAGLLILFTTYSFEFVVGVPSNIWLICHILRKSMVIQLLTALILIIKPLLLCLVCLEKYMAVVRPIQYLWLKSHRYRWGCLGVLWCLFVPLTLLVNAEHLSGMLSLLFLLVLIIDTFCCLSVLKTLQKPPPGDRNNLEKQKEEKKNACQESRVEEEEREQPKSRGENKEEKKKVKVQRCEVRGKGQMNAMKRKAFITIVIIQAALTLNYLPLIITLVLVMGELPPGMVKCQFVAMGVAAAASCSYLQPLLYLHRLGRLVCVKPQNN
ncbi:uncharacterized protein V6R79_020078 [Siganus canaliculatus]